MIFFLASSETSAEIRLASSPHTVLGGKAEEDTKIEKYMD